MKKKKDYELFQRYPDNPLITVGDLPYRANSIFNGAADSCLCLATADIGELVDFILKC